MEKKRKILLVDDDAALCRIASLALQDEGYEVTCKTTLTGTATLVKDFCPDFIILDVEIGTDNGLDGLPEIHAAAPQTPILFISSHPDAAYIVKALGAGAVSYLKKPFEMGELLAYIQRYMPETTPDKALTQGDVCLIPDEHLIKVAGAEPARINRHEAILLELLLTNPDKVVTREQMKAALWNGQPASQHSLNNSIARLRTLLEPSRELTLKTVYKVGYMLNASQAD